jgi:hypothetical protein
VTLTNTSKQDIFYEGYSCPFGLEVRDETGELIAPTPEGLTAQWGPSSGAPRTLHPGESIHRFARLDKEFKLDKRGNYFVHSERGTGAPLLFSFRTYRLSGDLETHTTKVCRYHFSYRKPSQSAVRARSELPCPT